MMISRSAALAYYEAMDDDMQERVFEQFRSICAAFTDFRDAFHQSVEDITNEYIATLHPDVRDELEATRH
jgi:hypothetical protein